MAAVSGGNVYFIRTDHIGRPVLATDALGAVASTISHKPFGEVHTSTGLDTGLRFPGQVYHWESELHQNWMRDYDPTTGRYIQGDPLGLVDGASVYGYAGQNPASYIDFLGLEKTKYWVRGKDGQWRCVPKSVFDKVNKNGGDTRISGPKDAGDVRRAAKERWGSKSTQHGPHSRGQFSHYQHKNGGRGHIFYGPRGGAGRLLGPLGALLLFNEFYDYMNPEMPLTCDLCT